MAFSNFIDDSQFSRKGGNMSKQETPLKGLDLPLWFYKMQGSSELVAKTRKDLEIELITQSLKDEEFKRKLLASPKETIENKLGVKLPKELKISLLEETENTSYMVIPCNPYEGILEEEELKNILGITYKDVIQLLLKQSRHVSIGDESPLLDDEASTTIICRTWRDNVFKQKLLNNPSETLIKELGYETQDNIKLEIFIETVDTLYIVLPYISDISINIFEHTEIDLELNTPMVVGSEIVCRLSGGTGSQGPKSCPTTPT